MVVRVLDNIKFPYGGWLSSHAVGPQNGRILVEIRGHSGMSSWSAGLMTFPQDSIVVQEKEYDWPQVSLLAGTFEAKEGLDRRERRIIRFYNATGKANYILFAVNGFLVPEASSEGVIALLECEGYSRTGRNGSRWALIVAPIGAIVAVEPYYSSGDPIYYRVTEDGIVDLGATDAVLAPDEW